METRPYRIMLERFLDNKKEISSVSNSIEPHIGVAYEELIDAAKHSICLFTDKPERLITPRLIQKLEQARYGRHIQVHLGFYCKDADFGEKFKSTLWPDIRRMAHTFKIKKSYPELPDYVDEIREVFIVDNAVARYEQKLCPFIGNRVDTNGSDTLPKFLKM